MVSSSESTTNVILTFNILIFFFYLIQEQQTTNVVLQYGTDAALACTLGGNISFYAINKDNTTSLVTADSTKYTIANSTLTIKSLSKHFFKYFHLF